MYPDNVDKVVALMVTMAGTGCVTGPLLGSFIYGLVGFKWTFIGFGIAMAPSAFLVSLLKNPTKDAKEVAAQEDEDETLDVKEPIVAAPAMVIEESEPQL